MPKGPFATTKFPFGLMEDGSDILASVHHQFLTGNFRQVHVMLGITKDEFAWFQGMIELSTGRTVSKQSYNETLRVSINLASKNEPLGLHVRTSAFWRDTLS